MECCCETRERGARWGRYPLHLEADPIEFQRAHAEVIAGFCEPSLDLCECTFGTRYVTAVMFEPPQGPEEQPKVVEIGCSSVGNRPLLGSDRLFESAKGELQIGACGVGASPNL